MQEVKDTRRAQVRIGFDGRVFKRFRGYQARERFLNELRVLRHLEERGCPFVPRVLEAKEEELLLVTTNCGQRAPSLSPAKMDALREELRSYGVEHGDWDLRNITYSQQLGRFCVIDFEYARLLDDPHHQPPTPFPRIVEGKEE